MTDHSSHGHRFSLLNPFEKVSELRRSGLLKNVLCSEVPLDCLLELRSTARQTAAKAASVRLSELISSGTGIIHRLIR